MISEVDGSELLVLRNRVSTLREAEKVKPPQEPGKPHLRVISVNNFHREAAAKLNTCPHELEVILQHAILTDNVMVQKAFKDFVMKAKLSLDEDELPMGAMRNRLKDCATQNENSENQYHQAMLNHHAQVVRIQQDVSTASAAVTRHWNSILEFLKAKLAQHKTLDKLRVWDRCAVEGIMAFYKEDKREDDAPPKCPLGRYKGGVRCSEAGWAQLAELPVKQIPDVIKCIESNYQRWKRDFLDKHVITKQERDYIYKCARRNVAHMLEELQLRHADQQHYNVNSYEDDYPAVRDPSSTLSRDLCDKYLLWLHAMKATNTDGVSGITDEDVKQHIGHFINQAVFYWEMAVVKTQQERGFGWSTTVASSKARARYHTSAATSSSNNGVWVTGEDGDAVFVRGW